MKNDTKQLAPREITGLTYKIQEEDPDVVNHFVTLNKIVPSLERYAGPFLYLELMELLQKNYTNITDWEYRDTYNEAVAIRLLINDSHVIVRTHKSYEADETSFIMTDKQKKKYQKKNSHMTAFMIVGSIDIFYDNSKVDISKLTVLLKKLRLKQNTDHNKINLICQDSDNNLYTKEFPVVNNGEYSFDLDLHYGEGFATFHETNVARIKANTKGIVLLHGAPGTGKTFLIKRLILDLVDKNKKILYLPTNIVDLLGTPAFNNFLLEFIDNYEDDDFFDADYHEPSPKVKAKRGLLIIIEDAERVLVKRENNQYGSDGVSNILNSTDGILNDFLNIMVLATFNCPVSSIDQAILRKKRALSVREFRNLTVEESQKLIDHLKIEHKADREMSLADIYALKQDKEDEILFEKKENQKIGFK